MRQFIFFILTSVLLIVLVIFLFAYNNDSAEQVNIDDEGIDVVVTVFPVGAIAQEVVGTVGVVTVVADGGVDPHDYEPSLRDVEHIVNADVLLGVGAGFDSWAERIAEQNPSLVSLFALEGDEHSEEHGDEEEDDHHDEEFLDPHFWLDPIQVIAYVEAFRDILIDKHPQFADAVLSNANTFIQDLRVLDNAMSTALASCAHDGIIVSHDAYGYLENRYNFDVVSISGQDPHGEATFTDLQGAIDYGVSNNISKVFKEPHVENPGIQRVAEAIVADVMILNPLELPRDEQGTYLSEMYHNLDALKHGLVCE